MNNFNPRPLTTKIDDAVADIEFNKVIEDGKKFLRQGIEALFDPLCKCGHKKSEHSLLAKICMVGFGGAYNKCCRCEKFEVIQPKI